MSKTNQPTDGSVKLKGKREPFALALFETGSPSEAFRLVYSYKNMKQETINNNAYKLSKNNEVRARVDYLRSIAINKAVMTREEAMLRLSSMARVSVLDIADFSEQVVGEDENGDPITATHWRIKNSEDIPEQAALSIKSVTSTKMGPKLEMHDPQSAIKQLAEMAGWNSAIKYDHTSSDKSMTPSAVNPELVSALVNKLVD